MTFQPVGAFTRTRVSDVVSDQIKTLISEGELPPGQRLPTERELAAQLNVSRPSLREALIRLEADGYIVSSGRGGFYVANIATSVIGEPLTKLLLQNPRANSDMLELRYSLESISCAYAAERATSDDLAKIEAAYQALATLPEKSDPERLAELDVRFHLTIADATHNVALIHVMHTIHGLMQESMRQSHLIADRGDDMERALLEQHTAIRDAIMARDPERTRQAAARHLHFVRELFNLRK